MNNKNENEKKEAEVKLSKTDQAPKAKKTKTDVPVHNKPKPPKNPAHKKPAATKGHSSSKKLKIIPLGGLEEIGKNMTVIEYGDDIFIVDCGMAFPEEELLGIDVVIPDISYLRRHMKKVKGIVLTHGHEDHIGALPYVLKELDVPVYGTKLTLGLVANKLKEHQIKGNLREVHPGMVVKLGVFQVEAIRVCHSIADAVAYAIKTPVGTIVHTGDFKIDFTPIDGQKMDLHRFAELGSEGVLCLLADSTNVIRPGYTMSESTVGDTFDEMFRHATSRIIVASFASNVHRIQQIINAAYMNGRKVAFSGRSMVNVSAVAMELGYLNVPKGTIVDIKDINRYPENEMVIVTTGSQGEPMSALARMANSEHRQMEVIPGDLIILSSSPIPGNEKSVTRIINLLIQKGAKLIYESLADVHVSGHAKAEELKIIHSLVKPKYFIPAHGEYVHLDAHKKLAVDLGMKEEDVFLLKNGSCVEFTKESALLGKNVPAGRIFIDGLGVGDVGNIVLRDRKHLSEDGLIIIMVALSGKTGELLSGPDLISRGFVYVRESEVLMNGAKEVVDKQLKKCFENNIKDWSTLKSSVRDALGQYIYQNTKRSPMILPVFMEV